jgi:hypothetical protein
MQAIPVLVDLDGGAQGVRVDVDQRDFAAAEGAGLGPDCGKWVTRTRYLAWSAGRRAGHWSMPWKQFNDQLCLNAETAPDYEPEEADQADEGLDPGRSDQTDGG